MVATTQLRFDDGQPGRNRDSGAYLDQVNAFLGDFLNRERERWASDYPLLDDGFARLNSFVLSGGKRLRPTFIYWGFAGGGGGLSDERLTRVGAAMELLHAFALIHDDIMDDSGTRRNQTSLHMQFEERHQQQRWRGEGRRVGEGLAILLGDLAFAYSTQLLSGLPADVQRVFDQTRTELHVGQFLDLACAAEATNTQGLAADIARFKTAKYTVERPLHIGLALAESAHLAPSISIYGLAVGEAFQHRDDLLGIFGDPELTGKPVGDDLRAGKMTLLIENARSSIGAESVQGFARLGTTGLTESDVEEITNFVATSGAVERLERRIEQLTDDAVSSLQGLDLANDAEQGLTQMAKEAAWRQT